MKTNKEICSYSVTKNSKLTENEHISYSVTKNSKLTISQSVKGHVWTLIKEGIHLNETVFQMRITWRYPEEYFFSLISSRPRAYDVPSQFFKATEVTAWKDLRTRCTGIAEVWVQIPLRHEFSEPKFQPPPSARHISRAIFGLSTPLFKKKKM